MSPLVADDVVQDSPIIYFFLSLFSCSSFPPISSLLHSGCKEQKEKRRERERERERVLIRKQNGKENGGETV